MINLLKNIDVRQSFNFSVTNVITNRSESIHNRSMNNASDSLNNDFGPRNNTTQLSAVATIIIIVLVCFTTCISVFVYMRFKGYVAVFYIVTFFISFYMNIRFGG